MSRRGGIDISAEHLFYFILFLLLFALLLYVVGVRFRGLLS